MRSGVCVWRCSTQLLLWIISLNLMVVMVTSVSSTTSQLTPPPTPTSELTSSCNVTPPLNATSESEISPSPNATESVHPSNMTSYTTSTSNLTSDRVENTTTSTMMAKPAITKSKSSPTHQRQTSSPSVTLKMSLSEEGQLGIIITCVLVGTGLVIAAVAFLTRFFNRQKTLTYEQRTNVPNGYINTRNSIEEETNVGTHQLRGNVSSTSLKTLQSV